MFKPGDVVVISEPETPTDGPCFVDDMGWYCGRPMTIKYEIGGHPEDGGWYVVDGGGGYLWAGDWMKKVDKFKGNK